MAALYGSMDLASAAPVASIRRPARGVPNKYPAVQNETIRIIDAAAEWAAITATAVGRPTKKLPFAHPFTVAKTKRGDNDVLTGRIASMIRQLIIQVISIMLKALVRSHVHPPKMRPTVVAAPKPLTKPAPVGDDNPTELAKSGKKKGGTERANTPTAPAMVNVKRSHVL
jgi:hypothetical protein